RFQRPGERRAEHVGANESSSRLAALPDAMGGRSCSGRAPVGDCSRCRSSRLAYRARSRDGRVTRLQAFRADNFVFVMLHWHVHEFAASTANTAELELRSNFNMQLWWKQLACQCRSHMLAPIYQAYEHRLRRQVRALPVPRHIGLILDGNRRFGRQNHLSRPDDIYMAGANKLDDLLDWCIELEIPAITLWVFSTENRKRPPEEVTGILAALEKKLDSLACDRQFHSRQIRVRAVGRLE